MTFEHQGCPEFESDEEASIPCESASPPVSNLPSPAKAPVGKVKINFDDLQVALEGGETMGELVGHFLDTETGEVEIEAELLRRRSAGK